MFEALLLCGPYTSNKENCRIGSDWPGPPSVSRHRWCPASAFRERPSERIAGPKGGGGAVTVKHQATQVSASLDHLGRIKRGHSSIVYLYFGVH